MATKKRIVAMAVPVSIEAAEPEATDKRPTFSAIVNTGQLMEVEGYDHPVVLDIEGAEFSKRIVANLDHNQSQRVGHVTAKAKDGGQIAMSGIASAATPARAEVVDSAASGFEWEASIEARPRQTKFVRAGKKHAVNGSEFTGPFYHIQKSLVNGFAFVSHGADAETTVSIAATAPSKKEVSKMDTKLRAHIEAMLPGIDVDDLSADALANLASTMETKPKTKAPSLSDAIEAKASEIERKREITAMTVKAIEDNPFDIPTIKLIAAQAEEENWDTNKLGYELALNSISPATRPGTTKHAKGPDAKVLEAAICSAGRLDKLEDTFDDQTLQAAHDQFPNGIGLKQLFVMAAEVNGYRGNAGYNVDLDVQRAAFGQTNVHASGFSNISLPTIFMDTANKFLREGWMAVDQTALSLSGVRSVRDFRQITTVSLTGDLMFEQVAKDGEIKHGTLGEEVYTNKADTYAKMLGITRQDMINDDLGALTSAPRRLGRGGMLKLNDIFWAEFLDNGTFFASGNNNVLEGGSGTDATLSLDGLAGADTVFESQVDPDGQPLGETAEILLVPTALKSQGSTLMTSQLVVTGADGTIPDNNIWQGRYRLESSPYMSNSKYTGNSAAAWYLLANPSSMPVIEIVALNGRVIPMIESADADFNTLGVQMRGYNDIGVSKVEYRGGVRADGVAAS